MAHFCFCFFSQKTSLPSKTPVLSEIRPRVLEFNSDKTTQDGTTPSYEDISPAGTPDVESEDQDALTGEDVSFHLSNINTSFT